MVMAKDEDDSDLKTAGLVAGVGVALAVGVALFGRQLVAAVEAVSTKPRVAAPYGYRYYLDPETGSPVLQRWISNEVHTVEGINSQGADMNVDKALAREGQLRWPPQNGVAAIF